MTACPFVIKDKLLVVKVIDGDTIEVSNGKRNIKIRLWGIDAPEYKLYRNGKINYDKTQAYGKNAKEELERKILNKNIELEVIGSAAFSRVAGLVFINGENVNSYMLIKGLAWFEDEYIPKGYLKDTYFDVFEKSVSYASNNRVGLWAEEYIRPSTFRKLKIK